MSKFQIIVLALFILTLGVFTSLKVAEHFGNKRLANSTLSITQSLTSASLAYRHGSFDDSIFIESMAHDKGMEIYRNYNNAEQYWLIASPDPEDNRYIIYNSNPRKSRVFMVNQDGIHYSDVNSNRLPITAPNQTTWLLYLKF